MNTDPPIILDPIEIQTAVALDDAFRSALIGQTLDEQPRFAYSLTALTRIMSRRNNQSPEHAAAAVGHMVFDVIEQHGDRAPMFIDDTISQPPVKEKSKIIRLGRN